MNENDMVAEISSAAQRSAFPDGAPFDGISAAQVERIAGVFGTPGSRVERAALEAGIVPIRYARNMKTCSPAEQADLLSSRVSIVGLGGLGGTVTEILARIGVGNLNLIDGDSFEETNLNRQVFSTVELLGKSKAEAAVARVRSINPSVSVECRSVFLDEGNAAGLLRGSDLAIDCLDNLKTRFALESGTRRLGIPLVSAAVAGTSGHVTAIFPEDRGLSLIYGESGRNMGKGAEATLGTPPYTVMLVASLECAEAVKILLKKETTLRNRLLVLDLADHTFEVLKLAAE